MVLQANDLKAF